MIFDGASVLITGGTGSFGKMFCRTVLDTTGIRRLVVYSRDELKQYEMSQAFAGESRLRFFLGDVRDGDRLHRAFSGVDYVVHAAALKQVPACEYNPFEAVQTNILGAKNVIDAAIDQGVKRVIALSTDKASSPINLYGGTKFVSDKLFIAGNAYSGDTGPKFGVVRYGNVSGSRGSVVPLYRKLASTGVLPVTSTEMTRFWITLPQGVNFVIRSMERMYGGELFVPKIPSLKITDLAKAIAPDARLEVIGIRPGEKLHEEMISVDDSRRTLEREDHYVVQPEMAWWQPPAEMTGTPVPEGFSYTSDRNTVWLSVDQINDLLNNLSD